MKKLPLLAILALLIACNQPENKSAAKSPAVKDSVEIENSVRLKNDTLNKILVQYIDLKKALVKSDSAAAQESSLLLKKSLSNYKGCEPTSALAGKIAESKNLTAQRKDFTVLSADLISLFKNVEITHGTIYVQHCPMANKGDGGDWLSTEKEIKNPYYGSQMLTCGRVTEEIKAK